MTLDKNEIIREINFRLELTSGGRQRLNEQVHEAPVIHAIIGTIVDAVNAELKKINERIS